MSTTIMPYLVKVNIILSLLYIAYYFLFSKTRHTTFNRIYLLSGLIIALLIPFIPIHQLVETPTTVIPSTINIYDVFSTPGSSAIENIQASQNTAQEPVIEFNSERDLAEAHQFASRLRLPYLDLLSLVWLIGVVGFLIKLVFNYSSLYRLYHQGEHVKDAPYRLVYNPKFKCAASFFNWMFWPTADYEASQKLILEHELVHKKQWHSLDIIMIELVKVFCWFLPFVYWWKKAIQLNHEYLTDEEVSNSESITGYIEALLEFPLISRQALTLHFSSFITQRIKRLTKPQSNNLKWLYAFNVPILLFCIFFFSADAAETNDILNGTNKYINTEESQQRNDFQIYIGNTEYTCSRKFLSNKDHEGLITFLDLFLSKEKMLKLDGQSISLRYKNKTINFSEQANMKIWKSESSEIIFSKGSKISFQESLKNKISKSQDLESFNINLFDSILSIHTNISITIDDETSRQDYVEIDSKKFLISNSLRTPSIYRMNKSLPLPKEIYLNGDSKTIETYSTYLFHENGIESYQGVEYKSSKEPEAILHSFKVEGERDYFLFYTLTDIQRPTVRLKEHIELRESFWKLEFYYTQLGINFEIEEQPLEFNWKNIWVPYYHSSGRLHFYPPLNYSLPQSMSSKSLFKLIDKSPTISQEGNRVGKKVFMDIVHIPRQKLPVNYYVVYNQETGQLEHDKTILKKLRKEVQDGDSLRFKNIRTKYGTKEGLEFTIRVKDNASENPEIAKMVPTNSQQRIRDFMNKL